MTYRVLVPNDSGERLAIYLKRPDDANEARRVAAQFPGAVIETCRFEDLGERYNRNGYVKHERY